MSLHRRARDALCYPGAKTSAPSPGVRVRRQATAAPRMQWAVSAPSISSGGRKRGRGRKRGAAAALTPAVPEAGAICGHGMEKVTKRQPQIIEEEVHFFAKLMGWCWSKRGGRPSKQLNAVDHAGGT